MFGGEKGIPPATGAVAGPALCAKKPFTGWFFTRLRTGRTLRIPSSFIQKHKRHSFECLSCLAERKGFEPLSTFLHYTISSRAPSTNSAISPGLRLSNYSFRQFFPTGSIPVMRRPTQPSLHDFLGLRIFAIHFSALRT